MPANKGNSETRADNPRYLDDAEESWRRRMPFSIRGALAISLLIAGTAALSGIGFAGGQDNKLPSGEGSEIAAERCLACHGPEPILQQRLPRDKWVGEVDKMVRWGADVPAESKDKLVDYLAKNFAYHPILPPKMPGALPAGDGREVLDQACLSCHGGEPISQQRLSRAQWTGEVDKMIRWGADVPADQKARLLDYLAKNFSNVK